MKHEISLDGSWRFAAYEVGLGERQGAHRAYYDTSGWLDAGIPGSTRSHLLSAGLTSESQWVSRKEWWYRTEFLLLPDFPLDNALLVFDRLPSSTLWLNGIRLSSDDSSFDVGALLKTGPNTIAIRLVPESDGVFGGVRLVGREAAVCARQL